MDTSEQYILMSEKAEEIQVLKPKMLYPLSSKPTGTNGVYNFRDFTDAHANFWCIPQYANAIWLPTQEQLQEMVLTDTRTPVGLLSLLSSQISSIYGNFSRMSMNQLWLALVMKELYLKVWSGTEWVKE